MKIDSRMIESAKLPRYKLSKTVRFELKPVGRTMQTFKEKFLASDQKRADAYPKVKELIDGKHKELLEDVLSSMPPQEWSELAKAYEVYGKSDKGKEAKDALAKRQTEFRKGIVDQLKKDERYGLLTEATPKKLFAFLQEKAMAAGEPLPDELKTFLGFASYFAGYQENRKNIYSDQPLATAVANRAINENFPKFLQNAAILAHIGERYPDILSDAEKELAPILNGRKLASLFDVQSYGSCLAQSGIETFNNVLGGFVTEKSEKTRGLNEFINLYRQTHEEAKEDRKLAPLHPLYKQILSDRESASAVPRMFENDREVLATLEAFLLEHLKTFEVDGKAVDVLAEMERHVGAVSLRDGIWIDQNELSFVSKEYFDDWSVLKAFVEEDAERRFAGERTKKKKDSAIKNWLNRSACELSEFKRLKVDGVNGSEEKDISELWRGDKCKAVFRMAREAILAVKPILKASDAGDLKLRERKEDVKNIKAALDAVMDVLRFVKPLHADEGIGKDEAFYSMFDVLYDALCVVVPLYNKVRNYLTKKPGEAERIKLMFDNPTLANGWDLNKEKDNTCVLFFKDGIYYLGVMVPKTKTDFSKLVVQDASNSYSKMVYKLLPGPNKMLPKVFFSEKGIKTYRPERAMVERYKAGEYKKGSSFDLKFCHELIDFFKASIRKHPDWNRFGFNFSPTSSYSGIDGFYKEVADQGYKISFENIPSGSVDRLVEEGELCLFKIWNKDFSTGSTGRPNLHTQYWRAAFSEENRRNVVIKLNGEAELFYRKTVIKDPFRHRVGEKMLNRRTSDGESISETIHKEIVDHLNGSKKALSPEAKKLMRSGKLIVKDVKYEIIKDRRFTEDKFAFHVPLTFNFKEPDSPKAFNDSVRSFLSDNPDVNIIGIDRGERNLLYLTMINQKGEILEQCSLNEIGGRDGQLPFDYHTKLSQIEKDRDTARKTWAEIGTIKDLKGGYLSQVVHKIARMMVEHNAIVVLEDLNSGFKRGRFRIEKQVYQKFEKALITKLNYLVFKERGMREPGGVLNAYQLTAPFESFEKLGKQTGFLFYVPAGYTSKIDPTTGFTNLLNTKKCTNAQSIRDFFLKFDSIRYEAHRQAFAFLFDYDNFKTSQESKRKKWTVYTATRRLVYKKCENGRGGGYEEINPTAILSNALSKVGVVVCDGFDLLDYVRRLEPSRENAGFFQTLFYAFDRTLQMRNSKDDEDYIESPVLNGGGERFDSRTAGNGLPKDADANGAYHIALKGLMLIKERMAVDGKADLRLEHKDWFRFVQDLAERRFGT